MPEDQSVAEAIRKEILKLAEGPITPDILIRIQRVAKTGRDLLMSLEASPSSLAAMVKRPANPFGIANPIDPDEESSGVPMVGSVIPYASAPPVENFGMTALREIISAAKNLNGNGTSPAKLVEAIAVAKEHGLEDIAKDLERQLGISKPVVAITAAPIKEGELVK